MTVFSQAVEDGFSSAVQFGQLIEPVADGGDLDFVQTAC